MNGYQSYPQGNAKYQQLYVPQLWAPNPNMVELEKVNKKYSKKANQFICLAGFLALSTFINITHKFNSFNVSSQYNCSSAAGFFLFGALINITWEFLTIILIFGLRQKNLRSIKFYLYASPVVLTMFLANTFSWMASSVGEECSHPLNESILNTICNYMEIMIITVFIFLARYCSRLMHTIGNLRERLLSTPLPELS